MSFHVGYRPSVNTPWAVFNAGLPSTFALLYWTAESNLFTTGTLDIVIDSLPSGNGLLIRDIEYRIDGGTAVSLNSALPGTYSVSGFEVDQVVTVELRVRTRKGYSEWSDIKEVTLVSFTPQVLFAAGEQGAWYDPSDHTTLYRDADGITPVTTMEQPVGLMLDKSKGLTLGPELVNRATQTTQNCTAVANGAGWNITATASGAGVVQSNTLQANKTYLVTVTWSGNNEERFLAAELMGITYGIPGSMVDSGTVTMRLLSGAVSSNIKFRTTGGASGDTLYMEIVSIRELPGNHAYQSTSASRPVLSARVNMLTYTEDLSNAAWKKIKSGIATAPSVTANAAVAPNGTQTADSVTLVLNGGTGSGDYSWIYQDYTVTSGVSYSFVIWLKAATEADVGKKLMVTSTRNQRITLTAEWQVVNITHTPSSSVTFSYGVRLRDDENVADTVTVLVWGADLRPTNSGVNLPPYQRVVASTNYDTAGFPQREYFDGVDDAITTAAGGGGTTAFFFCASINVAAVGVVQTLISDTGTNAGYRVRINASNQLELSAGNGSAYTTATTTGTVSAGRTYVVTCWHDGTNLNAQIDNGTVAQQAFATATAGTAAITVGKDNGAASGYFKGSIYAAIYVKDDVQTAAQISSTKKYCAKKGNLTL